MLNFIEKLLIRLFSSKIKKIEYLEKYDNEGNAVDVICIIHYRLFWFEVSEHFHKEECKQKDINSFCLFAIWEKK